MKNKLNNINFNISFTKPLDVCNNKYQRVSLMKNGYELGHIQYKYSNDVLYIDMIKVGEKYRGEGNAYKLLKNTINDLKNKNIIINKITSTEDGFSDEGLEFFENVAYKSGWKKEQNGNGEYIFVIDNNINHEFIINNYKKIGNGVHRNVYDYNNGKVIKISSKEGIKNYDSNKKEIELFKIFKDYGISHLFGSIDLQKSNSESLIMEKLQCLLEIEEENPTLLSELEKTSLWNKNILDFLLFKDCYEDRYPDTFLEFIDEFIEQNIGDISEDFRQIRKICYLENLDEKTKNYIGKSLADIHYSNVGIDSNNNIKILDFG